MQESINNQSMLKVGSILHGTYRIDSYLSSGGFGNTYIATNVEFDERVAIKEFFMKGVTQRENNQTTVSVSNSENHNSFLEQKEKFKKEARRIRQLKNEHIVAVHDLFEENGTAYYVMDFVDGENLSERLKRTGKPMTEEEVHDILPQILDALKSVHDAGIWHLDLKPANIMFDKSGQVKLIDFGASKQLNSQKGGATTSTAISYTNGFAPREQMEQNYDKFGPWTDIYALGATLYNLLTNKRPPLPTDIDDDLTSNKHEALPFPDGVSESLKSLVLMMMKTNRMQRPQSIDAIINAERSRKEEKKLVPKPIATAQASSINDNEETIIAEPQSMKAEHEAGPNSEPKSEMKVEERNIMQTSSKSPSRVDNDRGGLSKGCVYAAIITASVFFLILIIVAGVDSCINGTSSAIATQYEIVEKKVLYDDGSSYEGEMLNEEPNGLGTIVWPDGQKFEGEFDKGIKIWGTYTWPDKRTGYMYKYIGEFNKSGKFEGEGIAYYNGGDVNKGFWKNGDYIGDNQGRKMTIITRNTSEPYVFGSFKFELISVKFDVNKTIIKKKVTIVDNDTDSYYIIYSTKDECIEDATTGNKYYIQSSEIGFDKNSNVIKARYFEEEYPPLPSNVEYINIYAGTHHYVKNLKIK